MGIIQTLMLNWPSNFIVTVSGTLTTIGGQKRPYENRREFINNSRHFQFQWQQDKSNGHKSALQNRLLISNIFTRKKRATRHHNNRKIAVQHTSEPDEGWEIDISFNSRLKMIML